MMRLHRTSCQLAAVIIFVPNLSVHGEDTIQFGRDVLPILSTNCFACHGPDEAERQANLRLDIEADAKLAHDSGTPIVPGALADSTLIDRITTTDAERVMPPPHAHNQLKPEQIETLKRWVEQGAPWGKHWSFEPIRRPGLDEQELAAGAGRSAIDDLVTKALQRNKLPMAEPADPHQLVRRLWLDLIGLPPTPEIADQFAANPTPQAYEAMVDQLLASPRFGEHWARMWMDLARYADTKGYEKDLGRTMWPYRDWLIEAINQDMSLEQMTVEQLAGDLLPNPTQSQLIATAFHRNTMSNDEGGTDDEEFRSIAVKDRVDTTMQVWMGLTAGCAKCHTHKYDPISQAEYYQLYAVFNNTQDADRYDDSPTLELATAVHDSERVRIREAIAKLRDELKRADEDASKQEDNRWQFGQLEAASSSGGAKLDAQADRSILASGPSPAEDVVIVTLALPPGKHTVLRLEAIPHPMGDGQVGVGRNPRDPNFVLSELEVEYLVADQSQKLTFATPSADFEQGGWPVTAAIDGDTKTGWAVSPRQRERHTAFFPFAEPLTAAEGAKLRITMRQHYGDSLVLQRFRLSTIDVPAETVKLPEPTTEQRRYIDEIAAQEKLLQDMNANIPRVPIMKLMDDKSLRQTKIHRRGNFLDLGDDVVAGLPVAFYASPTAADVSNAESLPVSRLDLARWLMSRDNTLTPRVWANRIWARIFGQGIVETEEDFGALGSLPSNPELLDCLAAEYRDNGWSLKKLLKTIVLSQTYRQSSRTTAAHRSADPRNQLASRGARYRLSAETIRDQALSVAGLLSDKMGGTPVMPPQPEGLWRSTYNGQRWIDATGEDRFRRGIYTYLKRTTPYPSMTTFDGGSGEVCQIRRIRTNTPLQALITLNDPVYLESAGALATRMLQQPGDHQQRIAFGIRQAVIRPVRAGETATLESLLADARAAFANDPAKAADMIQASGASKPDATNDADFASWIVVANTILNLDEFLTRN